MAFCFYHEQQLRAVYWVEQMGISMIQCDMDGPECEGGYTRRMHCRFDNDEVPEIFPDEYWESQGCNAEVEIQGYGFIEPISADAQSVCEAFDAMAMVDDFLCSGGGDEPGYPVFPASGTFDCIWYDFPQCA